MVATIRHRAVRGNTPTVAWILYVVAAALIFGAAVIAGLVDLDSWLAIIPLSLPLLPIAAVLVVRRQRVVTVVAATLLLAAFVFLGQLTVGPLYLPGFLALLAGSSVELVVLVRGDT